MKKGHEELRPEYDLTQLRGGVRRKYYRQALAGSNLVLIEPELAEAFPDAKSQAAGRPRSTRAARKKR